VKSVVMAMAAKARRLAVCAWCRGRAHQSAKTHGGGTRTKGEHAQKAPARNGTGNNAVKFLFLGAQIPALVDLVEGQAVQRDVFQGSLLWFWPGYLQGNGTFAGWRATTLVSGHMCQL
jgi:hypothetical protein